ncbi:MULTISPECIES: hypothetical protein [unclassified Frankia]|nr:MULTISPECIES: hypothetical protein [unclassified Frankia]
MTGTDSSYRQVRKLGLANGFASCGDPAALQTICDQLSPGGWEG